MRKLVVGDIHGGLRGLKEVLGFVEPEKNDVFIFVGDYVDGWSDCAETIDFLIHFAEKFECRFIRGNHDQLLYEYLTGAKENPMWLNHGGISSIKSYAKLSEAEVEKHISFLKDLENFYIDSNNNLFLHAGFTNQKGPQFEYHPENVYWDRTLWEMVCALDKNISEDDEKYPQRLKLFNEIFIGHTPVYRVGFDTPANFANVWNVDTGAAFKGALSIMDIESKQVWQSTAVYQLYPEEQGRN
ncbi:metallophosphoesterase [Jejudonia soesokkakensis]|uniref:Metallophosphoesterase n=1 Tax=Jejudonia soesokkakensis TaxID=1323432 RepID=A0ABW2MTF1_9FLAO